MSISYTADGLITTLKLLPLMPSVNALFSNANLLSIMNFELMNTVIPLIDKQAEEYFVYNFDQTYVQSQTTYTLPYRGIGNRLREVCFVDNVGQEYRIDRLLPEQTAAKFDARGQTLPPFVFGFFLQGNKLKLYFNSSTGTVNYPTIRMKFIRQPNNLVLQQDVAQVTMISGNAVTVTNVPASYSTSVSYDFISNVPPFISLGDDVACTTIASLTLTMASVPSDLAVGDWICLSGQSPVPQIPVSAINYLLQESAAKCLEIHGDVQGFSVAKAQAEKLRDNLVSVITPRVDGNSIKLTSSDSVWDCA